MKTKMLSGWDKNHQYYTDNTLGTVQRLIHREDIINSFISLTNTGKMIKVDDNGTTRIEIIYPEDRSKIHNSVGYDKKDKRNVIIKRTITVIVVVAIMLYLIMR